MREIRILVIGDDGTGKSSLVSSLIKETFIQNPVHVLPEVTIPPEWTRERVTTRIVDSSGIKQLTKQSSPRKPGAARNGNQTR